MEELNTNPSADTPHAAPASSGELGQHEATARIEGLLDLGAHEDHADDNESDTDYSESDSAPEETPASAHEDDDTDPARVEPVIEPPKSWSKEEQAQFAELPSELRATIARRESERDTAISRKMNEVAEERKAVQAQVQQTAQVQQNYANTINQLLTMTVPELQQLESANWQKLATDDPAEYVRLSAVRDGLRQRVNFMTQQVQQAQAQQQQQMLQHHQAALTDQYNVLLDTVPEYRDPVKAKALVQDVSSVMSNYGFTQDEVGAVGDARVVRVMTRLAQLERQEQARTSAQAKKGGAPAPRFMTPNAAASHDDNQKSKIANQYAKLKKTGNPRDAALLLENII